MTLFLTPNQYTTTRVFARRTWNVLLGTNAPFDGALVTMLRYFRDPKRPIEKYQDRLETILVDGEMCQVEIGWKKRPVLNGNIYKPTREEREWLHEITNFINWAGTNEYRIQAGEEGQVCNELDFQLATFSVSAL